MNLQSNFFKLVLISCCVFFGFLSLEYIVFTQFVSFASIGLFGSFIYLFSYRHNISFKGTEEVFFLSKTFWIFSGPLIVTSLVSWSKDMGVRFFINHNLGAAQLAEYSLIQSISSIGPVFLQSLISIYYLPKLYNKTIDFKSVFKKVYSLVLLLSILFFLFFFMFKNSIVSIFLDDKYENIAYLLPLLFIPNMLFLLVTFSSSYFFIKEDNRYLIVPSLLTSIIFSVSTYLSTLHFGLIGVFYSSLFSIMLNLAMVLFLIYRVQKKESL
ncbi:MAG: hypothetical protein HAW67_02750 [Endozoicomonadaceae bacterium]|nr:hypothetical protein [Endozoicomonadaceae bacterium]